MKIVNLNPISVVLAVLSQPKGWLARTVSTNNLILENSETNIPNLPPKGRRQYSNKLNQLEISQTSAKERLKRNRRVSYGDKNMRENRKRMKIVQVYS